MPTASTAQILGNNECFEPFTSNVYVRRVLSGEFVLCNKHLVSDLVALGLWTPALRNELVLADGSVQGLAIPETLKAMVTGTRLAREGANRWLDNVYALLSWCRKTFEGREGEITAFFEENVFNENLEYFDV